MNTVLLFKLSIILSGAIFLLPRRYKAPFSALLQLVIAVVTSVWALDAWQSGNTVLVDLGIPFWGGTPSLVIDRLAAFFVMIVNLGALMGIIYGTGYLKPYLQDKSNIAMSLHVWAFLLLHISMLHVVMMREGFAFLMAWEVMSMSSFVLVIFEAEKDDNLKTGIKYLVQMHAGFTFLLFGFLWVSQATGIFGFDGLAPYFSNHHNWGIFLLLFAGFAIKAGFVPLHTWLPHAHPAAPSHVSGVMSGVMIKMGIYGILRVLIDVQSDFLIIGIVVMGVSIATGIAGILYATLQRDIKKVLAYSSIENIGLIGLGIGIALVGRYLDNNILTTLGLTGALLHVFNHSLYKSMLFFAAGNVYYVTHTRNIDKLGGLIRSMPVSGFFFLIGSLAICAIPPLNGFVSEFLMYKSVYEGIGNADFTTSMMTLVVILVLVIIGGLSVYTFTRTFGLTFLGTRRSSTHKQEFEVPALMRVPGYILTGLIVLTALFAPFAAAQAGKAAGMFGRLGVSAQVLDGNIENLNHVSWVSFGIFGVFGITYLIRSFARRKEITLGPTWGCGYPAGDFRHQYTSTSYANYVRELAGPMVEVTGYHESYAETEVFPGPRKFETRSTDLIEEKVIIRPVNSWIDQLQKVGWAQTGKINHYLVYPVAFVFIILLLTALGVL